MTKTEKTELAEKCYKEVQELGLKTEVKNNFVFISPPQKIHFELLRDITKCQTEFRALLI